VTETAYAKINFFLRITGRRQDGYHLLSTLMQTVSLCDLITVECSDHAKEDARSPGISLNSNCAGLPLDQRNTAHKAARVFLDILAMENISVAIRIDKNIPSQAGMGGGSADAAAVLRALDRLFPGTLNEDKMLLAAARIGADVPFCLTGGTQLCRGVGEIMSPIAGLSGLSILLVKPGCGVSTPWAFSEYDRCPPDPSLSGAAEDRILRILSNGDLNDPAERLLRVKDELFNEFEPIAEQRCPVISDIRKNLIAEGACVSRMSGSGSTVFGVFFSDKDRDAAAGEIQRRFGEQIRLYPVRSC
jgi:4-diphosphocytidyl-2-C-methyl-D-erythritol kinase